MRGKCCRTRDKISGVGRDALLRILAMRWKAIALSTLWVAFPLLAQRYTPYDPDWRQGRHDYKKTARAPWRCTEPATVSKTWEDLVDDLPVFATTADIDGDGRAEVFFAGWGTNSGTNNYTYPTIDNDDGSRVCSNAISIGLGTGVNAGTVLEGPITTNVSTGHQIPLLVVATGGPTLYRVDGACNTYSVRGIDSVFSAITVADVDGDGNSDLFWGEGTYAKRLDGGSANFTEVWSANTGLRVGTPALGDFNGDGNLEVCFPTASTDYSTNLIKCYRPSDGTFLYEWNLSPYCSFPDMFVHSSLARQRFQSSPYISVLLADDLDGDGKDELVARGSGCTVAFELDASNSPVAKWAVSVSGNRAPASGDFDGDGLPDVVLNSVSGHSGTITVLKGTNGSTIATFTESSEGCSAPTVADITGDGILDVITACYNPVAWSPSNGWSDRVWAGSGAAPYITTSDVMVARKEPGKLMIAIGDSSCYTVVWTCNAAVYGEDEGLQTDESPTETPTPRVVVEGRSVIVSGYAGELKVFSADGRTVFSGQVRGSLRLPLSKGVYFVSYEGGRRRVIVLY